MLAQATGQYSMLTMKMFWQLTFFHEKVFSANKEDADVCYAHALAADDEDVWAADNADEEDVLAADVFS